MGGSWGFIFECPLCCPAQLGGSLVTICLPRLRPAGVKFALLLQALPFCCGLRPAATGYALWRSLSVVAGCLGNGRLRQQWACISVGTGCLGNGWLCQQWACISVGTGCLGNGWLRQQWACISVGVGCLCNGGRPSPSECLGPSARGLFEIMVLFVSLGHP